MKRNMFVYSWMAKQDFRTLDESVRLAFRKRAIKLIESGTKKKDVAAMIGVKPGTISAWWSSYQEQGQAGLTAKKRGVKSEDKQLLSSAQEKAIQRMIIDRMPEQFQLKYALWTRKAVQELVERELGVVLAINTMGDYLRKWGFRPQRPQQRAYERCSAQVRKWLDDEYPRIKKEAKRQHAQIQWGDETGVTNHGHHVRSYALEGKTPVETSMSNKFSAYMLSTVTNQGQVRFMTYKGSMNAQVLLQFMKRLVKGANQKIFLILDNLGVRDSRRVKEWLHANSQRMAVYCLPAYSPDFHPDEYLNCDLNHAFSEQPAPRNQHVLNKNMTKHMSKLQESPERVKKYFCHKSIEYAA